jgi:citrate synthase
MGFSIFVIRRKIRYTKYQDTNKDSFAVKIGPQSSKSSSISASNADTIVVRGRDLTRELIGEIGFTDHFWLLLTGALPTDAQRRVLDATLVAIAEHGLVPSVQAARMTLAAAPEALQGAVAAGLLGCGSVVLGSSEAAGIFLAQISEKTASGGCLDAAVRAVIQDYRSERRPIPGFGHPLHKEFDPRARRLFAVAEAAGSSGVHAEIVRTVEILLPELLGKQLAANVSAAIPAVLLDVGYPLAALKGVPILARAASLIAHLLEEQARPIGFVMSHAGAAAIDYDGTAPAGFVPSHD